MFFKLFLRTCAQKRKHIRCYTRKQYFHTEHEESMLNVALSRVKLNFKQQCSSVIDGYTCIIADCPICNKTKKESKVYVNKRTGYFMCDNCKSTGSWELLEKFLSPEKSVEKTKELEMLSSRLQSKEDFTSTWENVIKDCQSIRDLSKEEYRILLNSFSLPHVPQEDMSELNCFYERASNALYFPLVGLNNNIVGYKLFSDNMQNEKTVPAAGASGCIKYKQHCNKSDTTALIVGMVDDLLTLISKTPANTILCLPYNLKSLPQQLLPYLESFKKFVLWFGNDDISWHAARSFARKLNEKRCCFIRPTDTQPRPTLAYFLTFLEQLHYPKDRMHLWIRSDNNIDNSVEILTTWLKNQADEYHGIDVNLDETISKDKFEISQWSRQRFLHVINLREQALNAGGNMWADFVWMLDADVFLTNPNTLNELIAKNQTVVAPMLKSDGLYSNFWAGMTNDYYYLRTEKYEPIFYREEKGCFNVPMIHSAVLIDLRRRASDFLTYDPNNLKAYDGPTDDIITFAVGANMSDISLFICNDHFYGFVTVPLEETETIADDEQRLINIKTEILSNSNYLPLSTYLEQFVQYPEKDTLGVDHIYMINLLRRPERRDRMHKLFRELGIRAETIDAIDGRALNSSIIKELGIEMMPEYADPYHDRPMTMGEIGCFLSHYNIWSKVIENGFESVIVLEDDVRFEPYFRQKIKYILAELDDLQVQWDLIYLGRKILAGNSEAVVYGSKYLVRPSYSYWTLGYILSGNGAKKLVGAMPLKHLIPVDEYLPILADVHPREDWKIYYPKRNLMLLSASPLLIYPTHYTGEQGYISDTENSTIILDNQSTIKSKREDL